jgi:hypothetical protein
MMFVITDTKKILNRLVQEGRLEIGLVQHQAGVDLTIRRLDRPELPVGRFRVDIQSLELAVVLPELDPVDLVLQNMMVVDRVED